jgi:integrase
MASKYDDGNFEELKLSVTRSICRKVVGGCKKEASEQATTLVRWIDEELLTWKRMCSYIRPGEWIFANTRTKGKKSDSYDSILTRAFSSLGDEG